jgi:hypothetical protein
LQTRANATTSTYIFDFKLCVPLVSTKKETSLLLSR